MTGADRPRAGARGQRRGFGRLVVVGCLVLIVAVAVAVWRVRTSSTPETGRATQTSPASSPVTMDVTAKDAAGVPRGWTPTQKVIGDYVVSTPGQVVEDLLITDGSLIIAAPGVTVQRVMVSGGTIDNASTGTCQNGLVIADTTITKGDLETTASMLPAVSMGGYTARRVLIDGMPEGFRVGGADGGCGPVAIENSYVLVAPPTTCGDWHGDGVQGYFGSPLSIRDSTFVLQESKSCKGNAPVFYPVDQGNASFDIDGILVEGGGFPIRLGTRGRAVNVLIVTDSWGFGPIDVECALVSTWSAWIVRMDGDSRAVPVRSQACDTGDRPTPLTTPSK